MSTQPGKPYTIMNKQSGLVLYLSEEDQISIIGENDGPEDRKTVRIACPFDSFC